MQNTSSFRIGEQVKYHTSARGHGYGSFIVATVKNVTDKRVTIEFERNGERVLRVVLANRLMR